MHEMSLVADMVELIEEAAKEQGFTRVRAAWVEIGQLAGVEKEALSFCFESLTTSPLLQSAKLIMLDIPGRARCQECHQENEVQTLYEACAHCGSYRLDLIAGDNMRLKELEVE